MIFKLGKLFPPAMRTAGWMFLLIGLYFLLNTIYMGLIPFALVALVMFLLGYFIAITPHGILIDIKQNKYKNYTSIFGYKQGNWKSLKNYPFITIIQNKVSTYAFSSSNRSAVTSENIYFDICLLDKTHQYKLLIKRLKDKIQALDDIKELAKELQVEVTRYKPILSQLSQKRKHRRR